LVPIGTYWWQLEEDERQKMSQSLMTLASIEAAILAPSFNSNYPTNAATTWFTKRAYAHFGNEATGVNG
jgi:hypothetical protein